LPVEEAASEIKLWAQILLCLPSTAGQTCTEKKKKRQVNLTNSLSTLQSELLLQELGQLISQ
jgi:hypothetical protein